MDVAQARALWDPVPGWLNTASYGLPPRPAYDELCAALEQWRVGTGSWREWQVSTDRARTAFARLVGVPTDDVAVGAQVSQMLAPVAAALPDGARVLAPVEEFTSNLFPWLVQAERGVEVRTAPVARLAEEIGPGTHTVTFALVQSATGEVAPYADIVAAARAVGAQVVVDATQGCGWLPFDATLADVVVVGGYKWLMGPRGTAFAYLAPAARERLRPDAAGWYAGADVHDSYYGPPLRLATTARRLDISPAWFSWIGTAPAVELVERVGVAAIGAHNVALADRFLAGLDRPSTGSAIVTVDVSGAEERLAAAGVRAAVRAGQVRASFHLYTTPDDVDLALDALRG
jgi:selenocysteine lyase/cysteine desulfurase